MAEHDRKSSSNGEFYKENVQSTVTGEEEGVDGEIDELEEGEGGSSVGQNNYTGDSPSSSNRDISGKDSKDSRKHSVIPFRQHRRHHSRSHRGRRRRSGFPSDADGEHYLSDEDGRNGSGRSKRRSESLGLPVSDFTSDKSPRFSHRKQDKSHGSHSHPHKQRSRQNVEDFPDNGELLDSNEDPLAHTRYVSAPKRNTKDKKDLHRLPVSVLAEEGEAEDGEILEDEELSNDEVVEGKDVSRDSAEVSSTKLSSREDSKGGKHNRKKSEHRDRRKRESDDKTKRKKYTDVDKLEDESSPAPAWGSGYQGPKPKASPLHKRQSQYGRGSKGYHSPPGLYDSPSYSEESDEEAVPKALITEGYIDASVAAYEKEGIFNPKVSLGKKKKHIERNDRKRGRNLEGKYEGPLRKKPLVMSERPVCKFYMEGKCAKGSGCQFNHDVEKPKKMEVCKYHLTVKGCIKQRCQYMHEDFPCKYYHTGAKCYSGDRCKFSHDALTEETRRALEMRVAAEDIIDMENPDYDYEYRPRESQSRPSLLGSPPRYRQDVKKIPSLFEIEVHPPGQSPKPSPQAIRPSGFYSETTVSPKPGMGLNSNGPGSSPNVGMINSSAPMNQQGLSNQGNMGGPGLLQTPLRPGNIMGGPMNLNRPAVMMGIQQGMNPQQQRPGGGTPIQFLGPAQMNTNQQGGNLPPVLNMLGAIIREAAMQKGPGGPNSNMNIGPNAGIVPSNLLQNMKNLGSNLNIMGPNNMQQGNLNIGPNSMAQNNMGSMMLPNNMGNIQSSSANNMGPLQNMMVPSNSLGNMGPNNILGNIGPNTSMGKMGPNSLGPGDGLGPTAAMSSMMGSQKNAAIGQEVGIMDVDYRIKPEFGDMEEASKDLSELDKIRQQIQAQIDKEDEKAQIETDDTAKDSDEDSKMHIQEEQLDSMNPDDKEDLRDDKAIVKVETEVERMDIPADLPKKQRELFKRIQQQQLLREKERKKQEALKTAEEVEASAEDDDWYSSDEDGDGGNKPKLTDVLKKLNQKSSASPSGTSSTTSGIFSTSSSGSSVASTFNIIQMINAIKSQTPSQPLTESVGVSPFHASTSSFQSSHQQKETFLSSPASPPPDSASAKNVSAAHHPSISILHLPELSVDPPVVNAHPIKPLVYSVVKISLNVPKPYTQLPDNVNASDQAFKDDPRVKWHLGYLEKQEQKVPQRRESGDGEKPQKQTDPRLKKGPSDPRLAKSGDSPNSIRGEGKVADPRLQRAQAQSRPADPRLARQGVGNLDPRLSRQNSQNNPDGIFLSGAVNSMGGGSMNNMGGVMNQMVGPVSNIGGLMNQMGSSVNQMNGSMNNNPVGGLIHNLGPVSNIGGPVNMSSPMNNQLCGPIRPLQGSGGPVNNLGGPFSPIGPGTNQMNRMGRPHGPGSNAVGLGNGNMMGGHMGNMKGPLNQQNQMENDSPMLDPRINSPLGPRPGSQRTLNDPRSVIDPRLKNRPVDPREQRIFTKEQSTSVRDLKSATFSSPNDDRFNHSGIFDGGSDYRSSQSSLRGQDDFRQGPHYFHGDGPSFISPGQVKMSQVREEWAPNSDHRIESGECLQPPPSSSSSSSILTSPTQYSDADDKPSRKFDHRNDPRFKRVKRVAGQPKGSMEYSSPLGGEMGQGDTDDGEDPGYNSYTHPKHSARDPRSRRAPSPSLPDTLQDFDLPNASAVTVPEPELDLKVKDLFKSIDPTASPFC